MQPQAQEHGRPPQQVNTDFKEQRQPETELEEIERRLHMAAAEIDWEEEVSETMAAEGIQKRQSNPDYKGDDMSRRGKEVGCRIMTFNAQLS